MEMLLDLQTLILVNNSVGGAIGTFQMPLCPKFSEESRFMLSFYYSFFYVVNKRG